jgi:hypothetical protein
MTHKHVGEIERSVAEASITAIAELADGLRVRISAIMPDHKQRGRESLMRDDGGPTTRR